MPLRDPQHDAVSKFTHLAARSANPGVTLREVAGSIRRHECCDAASRPAAKSTHVSCMTYSLRCYVSFELQDHLARLITFGDVLP